MGSPKVMHVETGNKKFLYMALSAPYDIYLPLHLCVVPVCILSGRHPLGPPD